MTFHLFVPRIGEELSKQSSWNSSYLLKNSIFFNATSMISLDLKAPNDRYYLEKLKKCEKSKENHSVLRSNLMF